MSSSNQISIKIRNDDMSKINGAMQTLNNTLKPYLQSLTAEQRKELPKMGDGTEPFVGKVLDYAKVNKEFAPAFMDVGELEVDYKAVKTLTGLYRNMVQLTQLLDDSIVRSGSEAFSGSLIYYNSVKLATKMNVPNAKPIYDDLKQRFAKAGSSSDDDFDPDQDM